MQHFKLAGALFNFKITWYNINKKPGFKTCMEHGLRQVFKLKC